MSGQGNLRTYLKVFVNIGILLVLLLLCIFVVPRIIIYFMPFVIGWIIALIASPPVRFLEKHLKIKRKVGSAVTIIAVIAVVIIGGYLLGVKLVEEIVDFIGDLPLMWEGLQRDFAESAQRLQVASRLLPKSLGDTIKNISENIGEYVGDFVGKLVEKMSSPTLEALSRFAGNIPSIFIGVIMCLLSAYMFVADKEYVPNLLRKVLPLSITERWSLIKRGLYRAVGGYFKAQFKIEVWMYLLLATGFWILRVRYAFLIAIGVALLDLLPFFGTGTILLPWAAIKFLSGDYMMVIGLLSIWGVGQLARQVIQPKIVGDSVGLAPIPTLILLFVGYKAAGVIGMIIAVPIGIIILNMYEEGVFDTFLDSLKILYASLSNFRHLTQEDMEAVRIYKEQEKKRIEAKERKLKEQQEKGKEA